MLSGFLSDHHQLPFPLLHSLLIFLKDSRDGPELSKLLWNLIFRVSEWAYYVYLIVSSYQLIHISPSHLEITPSLKWESVRR